MDSSGEFPVFDIQIEDGQLSLAPLGSLANHPQLTNFWAPDTKSVTANMNNISRYLRATDPHLSVVLSPGIGGVIILNLKIKTPMLPQLSEAISIASGKTISGDGRSRGRGFFGPNGRQQIVDSSIIFTGRESDSHPVVEVFNLSGYIQTLGKVDDTILRQKLDQLEEIIRSTLQNMDVSAASADPNFKFHPGTKLFIVIGKPEAIEVTRKIVNALSGQQKNEKADWLLDMKQQSEQQ
jgi:hypothetical protein